MKLGVACPIILGLAVWGTLHGFQRGQYSPYAHEMQNPSPDPPDAGENTEYACGGLRYRRVGLGTDSNKAEKHFVQGIRRLTRLHARGNEEVVDVDSDDIYNWPWLYAVEVGSWSLRDSHAKRLRTYLDRGGFLMVD